MIDDIKAAVHTAAGSKRKIAMFHLQILMHADELEGVNPLAFCKELAVPATYATEFRKMLSLARLMKSKVPDLRNVPLGQACDFAILPTAGNDGASFLRNRKIASLTPVLRYFSEEAVISSP